MSAPTWQLGQVKTRDTESSVDVIIARNVLYVPSGHRFQNLNIYLRKDASTEALVGKPVTTLPAATSASVDTHVHVHGGAWRDPDLDSTSIEPYAVYALSAPGPLNIIISLNYTLSPFPSHKTKPYDMTKTPGADPSREAVHPMHVSDVLHGFALLRSLGLSDGKYVLSGHSAGACLTFQTTLETPSYYGLSDLAAPPRPAALIGMNGLYDLVALAHDQDEAHQAWAEVYEEFQTISFGADQSKWPAASPGLFDPKHIEQGVKEGRSPRLVYVDQSKEDQLVAENQADRMVSLLEKVQGLKVVRSHRLNGKHAWPWEQGFQIWDVVQDVLKELKSTG